MWRVHLDTIAPPELYPFWQLERAVKIARLLRRGLFVLCEPPAWKGSRPR